MARAKKKAGEAKKRVKDLDPKAQAKNVKGGRTTLGTQVQRIGSRADRLVTRVGERINETGGDIEKATAPR